MEYGMYRHDKYNKEGRTMRTADTKGYNCLGLCLGTYTFAEPILDKEFISRYKNKNVNWELKSDINPIELSFPFSDFIRSHTESEVLEEITKYVKDIIPECYTIDEDKANEHKNEDMLYIIFNREQAGVHAVLRKGGKLYSKLCLDEVIEYTTNDLKLALDKSGLLEGSKILTFVLPEYVHRDTDFSKAVKYGHMEYKLTIGKDGYINYNDKNRVMLSDIARERNYNFIDIGSLKVLSKSHLIALDIYTESLMVKDDVLTVGTHFKLLVLGKKKYKELISKPVRIMESEDD